MSATTAARAAAHLARSWSPIPLVPRGKRPPIAWEPCRHRPALPAEEVERIVASIRRTRLRALRPELLAAE